VDDAGADAADELVDAPGGLKDLLVLLPVAQGLVAPIRGGLAEVVGDALVPETREDLLKYLLPPPPG
jgi:hypothetical protein